MEFRDSGNNTFAVFMGCGIITVVCTVIFTPPTSAATTIREEVMPSTSVWRGEDDRFYCVLQDGDSVPVLHISEPSDAVNPLRLQPLQTGQASGIVGSKVFTLATAKGSLICRQDGTRFIWRNGGRVDLKPYDGPYTVLQGGGGNVYITHQQE